MKIMTTATFAKKLGCSRKNLNKLAKKGLIQIQQSGFTAHSSSHPKLVVLNKPLTEIKEFISPSTSPFDRGETTLGYTIKKAKKSHICFSCNHKIFIGSLYGQKTWWHKERRVNFFPGGGRYIYIKSTHQTEDICVGCLLEKKELT